MKFSLFFFSQFFINCENDHFLFLLAISYSKLIYALSLMTNTRYHNHNMNLESQLIITTWTHHRRGRGPRRSYELLEWNWEKEELFDLRVAFEFSRYNWLKASHPTLEIIIASKWVLVQTTHGALYMLSVEQKLFVFLPVWM